MRTIRITLDYNLDDDDPTTPQDLELAIKSATDYDHTPDSISSEVI